MAGVENEDNQLEITQDERRSITHMSFELERNQLYRSVAFFHEQSSSAKLLLYHNFNQRMIDGVRAVYSVCVQPHHINEYREVDYLGYRMDKQLASSNLFRFDWTLLLEMERMVDIVFKDYAIMDIGDYITVNISYITYLTYYNIILG